MPENFGINVNRQTPSPISEKVRLGRQFGVEIDLSIFTHGLEINEENQFLKLFDENNNNILDENEVIKFKSNTIQAAGDDNILDDSEFVNLFGGGAVNAEYARVNLLTYIADLENQSEEETEPHDENKAHIHVETAENGLEKNIFVYNKGELKERIILTNPENTMNNDENVFYNKIERTLFEDGETRTVTSSIENGDLKINYTTTTFYKNGRQKEIISQEGTALYKKQERSKYLKNGKIIFDQSYTEYNNGQKVSSNIKFTNGQPVQSITTMYSSDGFIIEELRNATQYNSESVTNIQNLNNNQNTTVVQILNKNNSLRQQTVTNPDGGSITSNYSSRNLSASQSSMPTQIIKYDSNGNVVEITKNTFSNGILIGRTVENKQQGTVQHYDFSETNLEFEDSFQGGVGDCHYLETINSFRQTDEGKEALSALISKTKETDETGAEKTVYHVSYPSIQEIREYIMNEFNIPEENLSFHDTYDITEDELKEAAKAAGVDYSSGDKDVLLMEIALKKFRQDALNTRLQNTQLQANNVYEDYYFVTGVFDGYADGINGGFGLSNRYLLTGKKSDIYINNETNIPKCLLDMESGRIKLDESHTIDLPSANLSAKNNAINKTYDDFDEYMELLQSYTDDDGNLKKCSISASLVIAPQVINGNYTSGEGHAFTVKGIRGDDVVLINPWDSTKEVLMTKDDFKRAVRHVGGIKFD